jgi:dehydrogenase/reductase SDR family member 4
MDCSRFSLEGKVALVAGGSRGMGRACALAFADAGADVAVSSRNQADIDQVADEIRAKGRRGLAVAAHFAKAADSKRLVDTVQREFGRIDVLLNNAGTNPYFGTLMDAEEWAWDVTMNVNLKGPFIMSQLVARIMKERGGGSIINMSSAAAFKATILGIYSVTKAGLVMLTQCLAKEWGQYGIRVNALAPGIIETRFSEALWKDPAVNEEATKRNALGFLGVPDDVVGAALFLASDASRYITGTTIGIDGGELIGAASAP